MSSTTLAEPLFDSSLAQRLRASALLRFTLSALSGVMLGCAFPDAAWSWLVFLFLIPVGLSLTTARSKGDAFLNAWLFYTIHWIITVPWVIRVMSHYGGLPYLLGVGIFVLMALYLGLYGALFGWIAFVLVRGWRGARQTSTWWSWVGVALAWAAIEYLRTYALAGFPWDLIATTLIDYTPLVRLDRIVGPYILGAMAVTPALFILRLLLQEGNRRSTLRVAVALAAGVALWSGIGAALVARDDGRRLTEIGSGYTAALLQPNISQEMRWSESSLMEIFTRMTTMTETALKSGADIVVWPESTVPMTYATTPFYRQYIESQSARTHADIILGSVAEDEKAENHLWNAAYLVSDGRTIGHYDKIKLVPFGEYVPLRQAFFFAKKLVHSVGTFEFGTRETPLVGRLHYGLAICYEIVFPQIASTQVRNGADVLVTITNDAWYDGTSAPGQHLNMARMRAVETDRFMIRAGTTGISALVDPDGRLLKSLPMGQQGIIYAHFMPATTMTPYVKYGDCLAWLACAIVLMMLAMRFAKRDTNG